MSTHRRLRLSLLAAIATVLTFAAPAAQAAGSATLSGTFFFDLDRDGVQDAGEAAMPDQRVCLLDATGANLIASATTDAAGRYRFSGLDDGAYRVAQAASDWWALRHDWVPTTTGSIFPRVAVRLAGDAVADFGWRRIVRSTDLAAPITTYSRSDGLRVDSYDDVVDAREIYDTLMLGQLVGVEATTVRVLFDLGDTSVASWGVSGDAGSYENYRATVQVDYVSWLHSGDKTLFHEYGHAWSMYYAHMMQQSTALTSYLSLRGILDDPRLGSSHAWSRYELIAEDYRQLFGTSNARSTQQENQELPAAGDVPGLRDFLAGPYMQSPTPTPSAGSDAGSGADAVADSRAGGFEPGDESRDGEDGWDRLVRALRRRVGQRVDPRRQGQPRPQPAVRPGVGGRCDHGLGSAERRGPACEGRHLQGHRGRARLLGRARRRER